MSRIKPEFLELWRSGSEPASDGPLSQPTLGAPSGCNSQVSRLETPRAGFGRGMVAGEISPEGRGEYPDAGPPRRLRGRPRRPGRTAASGTPGGAGRS